MLALEGVVVEVLFAVVAGLLGAPARLFAQYLRDGSLPDSQLSLYARAFMSTLAGLLYYLITGYGVTDIRVVFLGSLIAGYAGVDFVENALQSKGT